MKTSLSVKMASATELVRYGKFFDDVFAYRSQSDKDKDIEVISKLAVVGTIFYLDQTQEISILGRH